jgi:putative redox protein
MSAAHPRPPIIVTHDGGVRFAAQIRSHQVFVDQTLRGGGQDTAPAPIELLGAALGTCIAYYVQQFCHTRGLPYEGMRVEVDQQSAVNPSRIGTFVVRVLLPAELPAPYAALIERVARSCPAHNTLSLGADVAVTIAVGELGRVPASA